MSLPLSPLEWPRNGPLICRSPNPFAGIRPPHKSATEGGSGALSHGMSILLRLPANGCRGRAARSSAFVDSRTILANAALGDDVAKIAFLLGRENIGGRVGRKDCREAAAFRSLRIAWMGPGAHRQEQTQRQYSRELHMHARRGSNSSTNRFRAGLCGHNYGKPGQSLVLNRWGHPVWQWKEQARSKGKGY